MWTCQQCNEEIEDQFDSCWKCAEKSVTKPPTSLECLRCDSHMNYLGQKSFREWGGLGINREHFDVYVCPRCGHVEFFVAGIGDESRPQ